MVSVLRSPYFESLVAQWAQGSRLAAFHVTEAVRDGQECPSYLLAAVENDRYGSPVVKLYVHRSLELSSLHGGAGFF